jgi:sortase A
MRKICPEDLTVKQIRYLILEKRRAVRDTRLEHFHRTGRVIPFVGETNTIEDFGIGASFERTKVKDEKGSQRTWLNGLLFGIEFLAIISLISVVIGGLSALGALNRTVAAALQQPTLEPTPMIKEVVLPDGHTPPNSPGGARPNDAEIPEHLRPLWQSMATIPIPTPGSQQAIRIQVPAIGVDAPVVQGDSWEQLKKGVAQHVGTPNPGENGNIVLSGHNDVFGEVFRDLDCLQPGDLVILFTGQRQYIYVITGTQMVAPTAVEVMAPTPDPRVTLISCHPYLVDIHRIVVSAVLQSS